MRDLLPRDANWAGFGISRMQFPMAAQAVLLGGNVRVGFEDTIYLRRGRKAADNAELVRWAAELVERLGADVATPGEARAALRPTT